MSCRWLFLASAKLCCKPGDPYCAEHQGELDYMIVALIARTAAPMMLSEFWDHT
jgi:hypothetical protein